MWKVNHGFAQCATALRVPVIGLAAGPRALIASAPQPADGARSTGYTFGGLPRFNGLSSDYDGVSAAVSVRARTLP
ncbi:hypothetical protein Aph02nite_05500 [Actinoplanes philippinensis]|nr:hypothetical protein Aph02nite_05500 [Actinoplanes philippinensis]